MIYLNDYQTGWILHLLIVSYDPPQQIELPVVMEIDLISHFSHFRSGSYILFPHIFSKCIGMTLYKHV